MDDANVNAGDLRFRVYSQAPSAGPPDQLGETDPVYANPGTPYWANIRNLTGRETLYAQQTESLVDKVIETRYPGFAFDPSGRFAINGRIFNISWVDHPGEAKRMIRCYCTEQVKPSGV